MGFFAFWKAGEMQIALPGGIGAIIALVVLVVVIIALLVPVPGWVPLVLIGVLAVARLT